MEVYDATPDSPYNSRETEILRRGWEPAGYTYSQKYDRLDMPSTEFHDTRSGLESLQFWQETNIMPLRRFDRNNSLPFDYGHPFLNSP